MEPLRPGDNGASGEGSGVDVREISFSFGREAPVFDRFSWRAGSGECWAVIGASGCGKTTLLSLLAGLLHPAAGSVLVGGSPVSRPRPETGLILQDHGLLPWAPVRDNVSLGLRIRRYYGPDGVHAPAGEVLGEEEIGRRADRWMRRLGIDLLGEKFPAQLSGGQRQRTAIARTLSLGPDLLLMDEPFSALDAPTREDLQNLVVELRREAGRGGALTTVAVTHNIEEAVFLGEKILVLGAPPNREARVIGNPGAGETGWRRQDGFARRVDEVRALVGRIHGGALQP